MDKGIDASWLSSAWGPSYFLPDAKSSLGDWRAAALPQWTAGADVAANWGGSTYPVFSPEPAPAAGGGVRRVAERRPRPRGTSPRPPPSLAVPDLPAAAQRPVVQEPHLPAVRHVAPERWRSPRRRRSIQRRAVAAVHDRGAHRVAPTVFAGVLNGKETLQRRSELPERPGELRQGAGLHGLDRLTDSGPAPGAHPGQGARAPVPARSRTTARRGALNERPPRTAP